MSSATELFARFRHWLHAPPELPLVCEVAADYVAAVRQRRGRIEAWATRPLPAGAVQPGSLTHNIAQPDVVRAALEEVLGEVGNAQRRCVLIVPDLMARVVLLQLDQLPQRPQEAEPLLRWRLGKDISFDLDQAVLSYQGRPGRAGGQEVVVAVCLRNLVRQYEEQVEAVGLEAGWVTLATMACLGWLGHEDTEPRLLVKRDLHSLGLAIVQGTALQLFRTVPISGAWSQERLFEKAYPAVVYFQEQWGQPVQKALLFGLGEDGTALAQRLLKEAGCAAQEVSLAGLDLPLSSLSGAQPDHTLLPSLGWVQSA